MTIPTIHTNGTSRERLLDNALDARAYLLKAIHELEGNGPNGRDYYPQGPDALKLAQQEHGARIATLRGVYAELGFLAEAISNA